ncbi:MAG: polyphosphate--AMP phosphotransferase [Coriobacteriia bacterium]|nr:polyphosphate--AMP phosphotransferase [Coriobacteriia bacterium]
MLERIDLTRVPKEDSKKRYELLVNRLILLQQKARANNTGVVVLFEGWDGAGKGSRISDLAYHLDARATKVHVTTDISEDEAAFFSSLGSGVSGSSPFLKQFWDALGVRGFFTFFDRSWYSNVVDLFSINQRADMSATDTITALAAGNSAMPAIEGVYNSIASFERQLIDDGYVVLKLFFHISKKEQRQRLESLHADPETAWRVSEAKLARTACYDSLYTFFDAVLGRSDFGFCPWVLVNGEDRWLANLTIAQCMVDALEAKFGGSETGLDTLEAKFGGSETSLDALEAKFGTHETKPELVVQTELETKLDAQKTLLSPDAQKTLLSPDAKKTFFSPNASPTIDSIAIDLSLDREVYKQLIKEEQNLLFKQQQLLFQKRIPLMIMYEGWDAAGKGGSIKRVAQALDARSYTIFPSGAPTRDELLHPFLWRYWTRLPKVGHVGIYDRSWYGRVLVERVEGFAKPDEWQRAYDEINDFERDMLRWGAILLKFWVNISPDEQLARFQAREQNPYRDWKITEEDWRNREKYAAYKEAIDDMFRLTSTELVPWSILEGDDKYYARIKALRIINEAVKARLDTCQQTANLVP